MNIKNKSWFTLIELIIAITIFIIISVIAFAPYWYYMNKAKVKHTNKELSQVIYEAKNMAIHGSTTSTWNISIGIYFDISSPNNNYYSLLAFEHDIVQSDINFSNGELIQKTLLQPWIQLDKFHWNDEEGIIFFRSITWSWMVFKWSSYELVPKTLWDNMVSIEYSYKWSTDESLQNTLYYFQDTQIVDY